MTRFLIRQALIFFTHNNIMETQVVAYGYHLNDPDAIGINLTVDETYQDMGCQLRKNLGLGCPINNSNNLSLNHDYRVIGRIPKDILDQNSKIQYWAAKPNGILNSIEDAFIGTPNTGTVQAINGKFTIDFYYPRGYKRTTGDGYHQQTTPHLDILIGDDQNSVIYRINLQNQLEYFGSVVINQNEYKKLMIILMILIIGIYMILHN